MVLFYGMNDMLVPIDKAGRVVLPKEVREELAINPGDLLKVSIHGNEVSLRPSREASGFLKRGRGLVFSGGAADPLENATVEAIRAGEGGDLLSRLSKGLPPRK